MGVYDIFIDGNLCKSVQCKVFPNKMRYFNIGDTVPELVLRNQKTMTICLPSYSEAKYIRIIDSVFVGLTDNFEETCEPYISKWNAPLTVEQAEHFADIDYNDDESSKFPTKCVRCGLILEDSSNIMLQGKYAGLDICEACYMHQVNSRLHRLRCKFDEKVMYVFFVVAVIIDAIKSIKRRK